ncbi:hypothetical protein QZH41_002341 [Actinostola sp. cb2023]|nr:hypothetical protein QZH41_002341 [Actinostola sp. cb2023]
MAHRGETCGKNLIREDLQNYKPAPNLVLNEKIRQLESEGKKIYHFAFGQSPFPVMDKARLELSRHAGEKAYLPVAGLLPLRKAICSFHKELDGLENLDPENVIVGPGSKELLFLVETVFQGDIFLMHPTWITYAPQARLARHKPIIIRTKFEDDWRVTPGLLEETFQKSCNNETGHLFVLCYPDNPTGTSYTAEQLKALVVVFRKYNTTVVTDEIYGRLTFEGNHESLAKYYPEGTILSTGLSKWAGAGGWRLGYHIYPSTLKQLYTAVLSAASHTYSCASAPIQYAALSYLNLSDESRSYMDHTRRILAAVAEYCYKKFATVGIKVVRPKGGFYMYPDFEVIREALLKRGVGSCQAMCDALFQEAAIAVMPWDTEFKGGERFTVRFCYNNNKLY